MILITINFKLDSNNRMNRLHIFCIHSLCMTRWNKYAFVIANGFSKTKVNKPSNQINSNNIRNLHWKTHILYLENFRAKFFFQKWWNNIERNSVPVIFRTVHLFSTILVSQCIGRSKWEQSFGSLLLFSLRFAPFRVR